jgi:hypothetical protein
LIPGSVVLMSSVMPIITAAEQVEKTKKPAYTSAELLQLDQEAQWQFEPMLGRIDPFYDREALLRAEQEMRDLQEKEAQQSTAAVNPNADVLVYAAAEQVRIESLVAAQKYEEAIRTSDLALKRLEKNADLPEVQAAMARITTFRDQADDALTRDEAQAQFDSLGLKIEGILWSETGTRLVILTGEAKAVGVNERVKDCVIINIDTDRVDFRFHYKRKRFEFPRYVGEDAKTAANSK